MSKEESLKRVELKVNVNCCDGCKKKVLKALNIKGVLKTEIHPTLPKVTVTGTVDVGILIKKLAKYGKASELLQTDYIPQSREKESKKNSTDSTVKESSKEQKENSEKMKEIIKAEVSCSVNHGTVLPASLLLPEAFGVAAPCCARQRCCNCGVPAVYQSLPPAMAPASSPEGGGFADYFNDENTMGCCVM